MCFTPKMPNVAAPLIASTGNAEATSAGSFEASLRRARAGAAANILTGPMGIPYTTKMGEVA